jgi:hypothetical protein
MKTVLREAPHWGHYQPESFDQYLCSDRQRASPVTTASSVACVAFTMNYSLISIYPTPVLGTGVIVPHCFLREQGGKKAVFDPHIWEPFGKMQPVRLYMGPEHCCEMPFLAENQWRGGKASRHHACITIPNSTRNRSLPRRPQTAIAHSGPTTDRSRKDMRRASGPPTLTRLKG